MSNIVQLKRAVKLDMTNRSSDVRSVRQLSIEAMRHVLIDARAANSAAEGSEARMVAAGRVCLRLGAIVSYIRHLNYNSDIDWLASMASELRAQVIPADPKLTIDAEQLEHLYDAIDTVLDHYGAEMELYDAAL